MSMDFPSKSNLALSSDSLKYICHIQSLYMSWRNISYCLKYNGNPLQYSCLENPMDRGAWWASLVHGVTKSQTRLSDFTKYAKKMCICSDMNKNVFLRAASFSMSSMSFNHYSQAMGLFFLCISCSKHSFFVMNKSKKQ